MDHKPPPEPVAGLTHIKLFEQLRKRLKSWPAVLPSKPGDPIRPIALGYTRELTELLIAPDDEGKNLIKETICCGGYGRFYGARS